MKHGKKMTKEEIERKKKKIIRIFLIILFIIALAIGAIIANDYIIFDKNEKINLVINNNNVTANLKNDVLVEDDVIYVSKQDISSYFDRYIYLDESLNKIITTYEKKIATIGFEDKTMNVNGSDVRIYATCKKINDVIYLPISEMKDVYSIEPNYIEDTKVVTLDSTNRELRKAMVAKGAAVKSSTAFISKTLDRVEEGSYVIVISKTDDGWTKIRSKNGIVGYVKNDVIVNEVKIRDNMEEEKQIQGKVSMVWDFYSQYVNAPDRSGKSYNGVNVVSPSFFYINKKGDFKENVGSKGLEYIEWAHQNGYKVWPMISNSYETDMLETTSTIMNSFEKRQALIENIVNACVEYKVDGINIDFENMKKEDKDMFSRFIIELTPRIKEIGMVVSVDVTAPDGGDTWSLCYDRNVIGHEADYIVFMAYDEYTASSSSAGTTAGVNWINANLNKFIKYDEVKPEKIILGIPFYTRLWTEKTDGSLKSSIVNMKDVNNVIPSSATKEFKEDVKQNYVEYQESGATKKMWIEDIQSIKCKLDVINEYQLGGASFWALDREDPDVWDTVKNELSK
ncbi:MAG: hypothetical protein IJH76_02640 [Clostridia bacterium]|nr:hypothetical protein [Clostridia bacterium]